MITINYQKRKNAELFKRIEEPDSLFLSKTQNYIPIYSRFFNLNETNYNSINLNNKWYISNVEQQIEDNDNLFVCKIKNIETNKVKNKEVFFKMAPLLDPYKYMIGKYETYNSTLFNLPKLNSTAKDCDSKFIDTNNSAYVDGLFLFLSSQLIHSHKFIHGVEYYGSFLGIKNEFKINVFDDIDYLNNSDFFNKNKNILFKIDDYDHLFQQEQTKLKPLTIGNNISLKSLSSVDNELFADIFEENDNAIDLNDLKDLSLDLVDITNVALTTEHQVTLKTNSTCSSRSSHTNDDDLYEECENCDNEVFDSSSEKNSNCADSKFSSDNECNNKDEEDEWEDEEDEDEEDEEEIINVFIPKFPVQVIGMEYCENTFDDLILNNELSNDEWYSAFMQIIMILIAYQKAFNFTHNDLHTNNVMYNKTDKKYLYYCYKKKYYKVPTFGRIFKIIDFGRSIFKFDGKIFCSDSFQSGGDAATQYNTEPYFNDKKPRLEPNYSFDLCRLACSIFDYVIDDFEEIKDSSKIKDPIKKLIFEWCLDDKGINMLYKNNGVERYPDFKLYKMIARCVHNHTPQAQLDRPEFDAFSKFNGDIKNLEEVINLDKISSYI
jgi:hypothetical protein